jgi:cytochrome P450
MLMKTTMDREPIAANEDELADLVDLSRLVVEQGASELSIVGRSGEVVPLGDAVVQVLRQAVEALSHDQVVLVSHLTKDLTFDQVADLLDVPYEDAVRRVSERGVSTQEIDGLQRVRFADAILLKRERDVERREALRFLADQGQDIQAIMKGARQSQPRETAKSGVGA